MITLALDLAVIGTIVFCGWRGYKNGLIRGVFGVVSLIVSLFLASTLASAYSGEFTEMLKPFVGGIIDSAIVDIAEDDGEQDVGDFEDESENFITAYSALRRIGLPESSSARIAEMTVADSISEMMPAVLLSDFIADKLSSVLAYAAVFGVAFLLMAIVFAVVGNLVGFIFSLPGLKLLDIISGAAFGLAKGFIIVYAVAVVMRYAGLLAPDILAGTSVLKNIVNNNPIATIIGI